MELWKMIIPSLLRVRVSRNGSTWNAISKVLRTTSDASIYNSDISNNICHPSRRHHHFQERHHPPEANSSQFPSSKGESAKPRAYQLLDGEFGEKTQHTCHLKKGLLFTVLHRPQTLQVIHHQGCLLPPKTPPRRLSLGISG